MKHSHRRSAHRPHRVGALGIAVALGALACAAVSKENMVPAEIEVTNAIDGSVALSVVGGVDTTFAGIVEEVPIESFEAALRQAIRAHGPFSSVAPPGEADYLLEVTVFPIENLDGGKTLTFNYKLVANWRLTETMGSSVLSQERIDATHTVTVGDAFSGATRMVRATEGVCRKNIKAGLESISLRQLGAN